MIEVARTVEDLRARVAAWRGSGERIGFVPTMGALHEGHLSLVRYAREQAARTLVSIYVNPAQFGPNEDFDRYPRDPEGDLAKLEALGVDLVYMPETLYAPDHLTWVTVERLGEGLCAVTRPQFFRGVATVVLKLFHRVRPDFAVFGEKDYQQLLVVQRMVRDLDLEIEVIGRPTVREADGLALSSRNAYLSPEERRIAPAMYRALMRGAEQLARGARAEAVTAEVAREILGAGYSRVDYVEFRDAATLEPRSLLGDRPGRLLAAAFLGSTRLIDNVPVTPQGASRAAVQTR